MIAGLERFVAELRREGINASPAEWVDALRAMEYFGLEERERVRLALRATLVKRARQQPIFDRLFDRFFAPPARGGRRRDKRGPGPGPGGEQRSAAREGAGLARGKTDPAACPDRPARRARTRETTHEARDGEALRRRLSDLRDGAPRQRGRLRRVIAEKRIGESDPRRLGAVEPHPLQRELRSRMGAEQEREIAREVPRLIERLRLRSGRRLRRSKRGRLYLRRVFRENLAHGGVPLVLPRRVIEPRRSRVVLLVDVSYSTARAAGLFLWIACEFLRLGRTARVLLFVDRPVEATSQLARWMRPGIRGRGDEAAGPAARRARRRDPGSAIAPSGLSFDALLRSLDDLNLDAPSDYGRAFHALLRSPLRPVGRGTTLVVLGDGRTNRFDPQEWAFEEIAGRCGAVLWLVPEPLERWGTGDSALGAYLSHTDVAVEARDLLGLSRGMAEMLRSL